jgi:hypothetical protein
MTVVHDRQWGEFKARLIEHGVCTNYAARALLVQDYVEQEINRRIKIKNTEVEVAEKTGKSESNLPTGNAMMNMSHRSILSVAGSLDDEILFGEKSISLFQEEKERRHRNQNTPTFSRATIRRNSFTLAELLVAPPEKEEAQSRSTSKESRREGFDSIVASVVGNLSLDLLAVRLPSSRWICTLPKPETNDSSFAVDSKRPSFLLQQGTSVKASSIYLRTFVSDDSADDDEAAVETTTAKCSSRQRNKRSTRTKQSSKNSSMRSSRSTLLTQRLSISEMKESYEVRITDHGNIVKEEEILVDFPSLPRSKSMHSFEQYKKEKQDQKNFPIIRVGSSTYLPEHDSDITDDENDYPSSKTRAVSRKLTRRQKIRSSTGTADLESPLTTHANTSLRFGLAFNRSHSQRQIGRREGMGLESDHQPRSSRAQISRRDQNTDGVARDTDKGAGPEESQVGEPACTAIQYSRRGSWAQIDVGANEQANILDVACGFSSSKNHSSCWFHEIDEGSVSSGELTFY